MIKKLNKYILILSILFVDTFAWAMMYNISSRYLSNTNSTGFNVIKGSAFLVGYSRSIVFNAENFPFDRYFLVTASHVSQGDENKIELNMESEDGKLVPLIRYDDQSPIIGRLSDNWNDIEIIEIDRNFVLKNKLRPLVYGRTGSELALINRFTVDEATNKIHSGANSFYFAEYLFSFLESSYNRMFLLFPNKRLFNNITKSSQDQADYSIFDTHFLSHFKIANSLKPGMSGAPLLYEVKGHPSVLALRGVGIQYDKLFRESIYVSGLSLKLLFDEYFQDKRGLLKSSPLWKNESGKTFRTWQTFIENKDQNVGGKGDVGESETPFSLNKDKESDSEVTWNGHNVFGLKLSHEDTNDFSDYLWANMASLKVISSRSSEQIENQLILEKDLNSRILIKLLLAKHQANKSFWSLFPAKKTLSIEYGKGEFQSLSECKVLLDEETSMVELTVNEASGLEIKKSLDLNSKFKTTVSAFNETTSYVLDIKQLFFTDLLDLPNINEYGNRNPNIYSNGLMIKYQRMSPTMTAVGYIRCDLDSN